MRKTDPEKNIDGQEQPLEPEKKIAAPEKLSRVWIAALVFIAVLAVLTFFAARSRRNARNSAMEEVPLPTPESDAELPERTNEPFVSAEPSASAEVTQPPKQTYSKTAIVISGQTTVVLASREAAEELIRNVEQHFLNIGKMPQNVVSELSTEVLFQEAGKEEETTPYDEAFELLTGKNSPIVFQSRATFVEETSLPHSIDIVEDETMPVGLRIVEIFGRDGIQRSTHTVIYINGVEQSSEETDTVVVSESVNTRVRVGTMAIGDGFVLDESFGADPSIPRDLRFSYPVKGTVIKLFGPWAEGFHQGIDIGAKAGALVKASCKGTVVSVMERGAYGLMVEIDHGSGVTTRYAMLDSASVAVGDTVEAGTVIGRVSGNGNAGYLHFELRVNGTAYNPLKVLN